MWMSVTASQGKADGGGEWLSAWEHVCLSTSIRTIEAGRG